MLKEGDIQSRIGHKSISNGHFLMVLDRLSESGLFGTGFPFRFVPRIENQEGYIPYPQNNHDDGPELARG